MLAGYEPTPCQRSAECLVFGALPSSGCRHTSSFLSAAAADLTPTVSFSHGLPWWFHVTFVYYATDATYNRAKYNTCDTFWISYIMEPQRVCWKINEDDSLRVLSFYLNLCSFIDLFIFVFLMCIIVTLLIKSTHYDLDCWTPSPYYSPLCVVEQDEHAGATVILETLIVMPISITNEIIKYGCVDDVQQSRACIIWRHFLYCLAVTLIVLPPGGLTHTHTHTNPLESDQNLPCLW